MSRWLYPSRRRRLVPHFLRAAHLGSAVRLRVRWDEWNQVWRTARAWCLARPRHIFTLSSDEDAPRHTNARWAARLACTAPLLCCFVSAGVSSWGTLASCGAPL